MTVDEILVKIDGDMSGLRKDLDRIEKHTKAKTAAMGAAFKKVGIAIAAVASAAAMGAFVKSTLQVGMSVEGLRVQLKGLLGSAEEGEKAFAAMNEFASRVPFSLGQIQEASGSLAAATKNAEGMADMMQITGNIAAQFNIPFELAAENVQRALSAGAASADLFQKKGVNAMMGFQSGVSISTEETAKKLFEFFGKGGKYDGAMDEFALTTGGAVSMFQDAIIKFQTRMAESGLAEGFSSFVESMTEVANKSGGLADALGSTIGAAFRGLGDAILFVDRVIGPVGEAFSAFGALVGSVVNALDELFKPATTALSKAFGDALEIVQQNLRLIVITMSGIVAFKIGTVFMTAAAGAFAYAKTMALAAAANIRFAFSFKTLRKAIPGLTAVLIALGEGLDEFAEKGREGAKDLLPESLKEQFGIIGGSMDAFGKSVSKAYGAIIDSATRFEGQLAETMDTSGDAMAKAAGDVDSYMANLRGSGDGKLSQEATKLTENLTNENAKLKDQIQQLTVGTEKFTNVQMRLNEIKRQNKDLTAVEIAQIETLLVNNEKLQQGLSDVTQEKENMKELGETIKDSVGTAIEGLIAGTTNAKDAFRQMAASIIKNLIDIAFQMDKTAQAGSGGGGGGFLGFLGKMLNLGGSATQGINNLSDGALLMGGGEVATGGSVNPMKPYLVGERGPEIVIPKTAASVMNSNNTRSAMGGGSGTIVQQVFNISTGVQDTVRAEIQSMMPQFEQRAVTAVASAKARGGTIGRRL